MDLAAWPLVEHKGIVIHVHGGEHFLTYDEAVLLTDYIQSAVEGRECFGADYTEAHTDGPKIELDNLRLKLGLGQSKAAIKRRKL